MAACDNCGSAALVMWNRRPTDAELSAIPEWHGGSTATGANTTVPVYACGSHAISVGLAGLIHGSACSGPLCSTLPDCDCTPEPAPAPEPEPVVTLPEGWA
jgi:hypothetical protein